MAIAMPTLGAPATELLSRSKRETRLRNRFLASLYTQLESLLAAVITILFRLANFSVVTQTPSLRRCSLVDELSLVAIRRRTRT